MYDKAGNEIGAEYHHKKKKQEPVTIIEPDGSKRWNREKDWQREKKIMDMKRERNHRYAGRAPAMKKHEDREFWIMLQMTWTSFKYMSLAALWLGWLANQWYFMWTGLNVFLVWYFFREIWRVDENGDMKAEQCRQGSVKISCNERRSGEYRSASM